MYEENVEPILGLGGTRLWARVVQFRCRVTYAERRAASTLLVQLTGNAVAAQFVLRHKNLTTTTAFYVKPVQTAAVEGMKLVEETLATRKALAEANGK